MQCIHLVKIKPVGDGEFLILKPLHLWLRENNITRFRGGYWPNDKNQNPETITFRFADIEDAVAFKLRWCE